MVNYEYPPLGGGAGKANKCLLNEFANSPLVKVDLLTSGLKSEPDIENPAQNITIYKIPINKKNLHYWKKNEVLEWLIKASNFYQKLLNQNHYHLAHAFFAFPSAYLCFKNVKKLPYIISLRGSDVPGYNPRLTLDYIILKPLFKKIWNNASAVIANSNGLAQLAAKFTPKLTIDVIPNGVYLDNFIATPKNQPHNPPRLITVSRLINRKRLDLIIRAVAICRQKNINISLTITGQGNLKPQLLALTKKLNLTEQIKFTDRIPYEDMNRIYNDHDIFIMSSLHEGMSNAMLEAAASALPIVTVNCEGARELVNENGIITENSTPHDLAGAVMKIIDDPEKFRLMSTAAIQKAKKFTWQNTAQKYLKYYKSITE